MAFTTIAFILYCFYLRSIIAVPPQCPYPSPDYGPVCFEICYCPIAVDNTTVVYCDDYTFPIFSSYLYNTLQISAINVIGTFTVLYDNSFYLLTNLSSTSVCISSFQNTYRTLTTYDNTFLTRGKNGITSLTFFYYNPVNLTTMSNIQDIQHLTIIANLGVPPNLTGFTSLTTLSLTQNVLTTLDTAYLPSLTSIDASYNMLTTLDTAYFPLPSLTSIDASYNKISTADPLFSKWLSHSAGNIMKLNNNGPWQCDSSLQWMASYVICTPRQIVIDPQTALCQNGEPLVNWFGSYAKCIDE